MTIFITYIATLFLAPLLGTVLSRFATPKKQG
jgi:hypothetical protein